MAKIAYNIAANEVIQKLAGATVNMPAIALCGASPAKYKMIENETDGVPIFCDMDANIVSANYPAFKAVVAAVDVIPFAFVGPRPPHRIVEEEEEEG